VIRLHQFSSWLRPFNKFVLRRHYITFWNMRIYNIRCGSIWYFDIVYWRKLIKLILNLINILKLYYNSIISCLFSLSIRNKSKLRHCIKTYFLITVINNWLQINLQSIGFKGPNGDFSNFLLCFQFNSIATLIIIIVH